MMDKLEESRALVARIEVLEQTLASKTRNGNRSRRVVRSLVGIGVLGAILVATVAVAGPDVSLVCSAQDELELFCFNPQEPAMASEVTHNFLKVKEWMERKVGDVDSNVDNVNITGNLSVDGNIASTAGNLSVDGNIASTGGYLQAENLQTRVGNFTADGAWHNTFELPTSKTHLIFGTTYAGDHSGGSFVALAGPVQGNYSLTVISSTPGWSGAMTDSNIQWNGTWLAFNYNDGSYGQYTYRITVISSAP